MNDHHRPPTRLGLAVRGAIGLLVLAASSLPGIAVCADDEPPWANDPRVQQVLALRQRGIEEILAGRASTESENYSSTFVANTPNDGVLKGADLLARFAGGSLSYASIEQHIEYAGAHGDDMVVLMGVEIVVPGPGLANAGKRVHRRFTDVFRMENGAWRHDLRHANVIEVEVEE